MGRVAKGDGFNMFYTLVLPP